MAILAGNPNLKLSGDYEFRNWISGFAINDSSLAANPFIGYLLTEYTGYT
jgi:hypothetical protein